jgi:dTDP-glucose pyrophosphorylase
MKSPMKAVILAAGKGTRMGELTAHVPKPMKEVATKDDGSKPILEHIVRGLRDKAGIRDFFIITGWCGHVIREYFGDGSRFQVNVSYGEQIVQDGTGKAPELAKEWIAGDKFLLMYGDILLYSPDDYEMLVEAFQEDGVIALKKVSDEELCKGGAVVLNQEGFMAGLVEKAPLAQVPKNAFYNAGIYLLTPRIFDFTARLEKSPRHEYEFTDALRALYQSGARIRGVTLRGDWADVRDPAVLAELNIRAKS